MGSLTVVFTFTPYSMAAFFFANYVKVVSNDGRMVAEFIHYNTQNKYVTFILPSKTKSRLKIMSLSIFKISGFYNLADIKEYGKINNQSTFNFILQ